MTATAPGSPEGALRDPLPRRLGACARRGLLGGLRTLAWLVPLVIGVSFAVSLLSHFGVLAYAAAWLAPVFRLFGLPEEAAVAYLTGALVNCYSGIAAASAIALDDRQMTILALMILFSHNLVVEVPVQKKAGSSAALILALRLGAAVVGALALNLLLPPAAAPPAARAAASSPTEALGGVLAAWAAGTALLSAKIVVIVLGLTVLQRMLDELGGVALLGRLLAPVLAALGLSCRTAFLWTVANTLGLAFGAAVILDRMRSDPLPEEDVGTLNVSVALCHSLIEDTLLFVAVGAWAFWITVPRIALAAVAAWAFRGRLALARRKAATAI